MAYVFGNDYGGVQSAKLAYDQLAVGMAESDRAARERAAAAQQQEMDRQQELQQQQDESQSRLAYTFGQAQQQQRNLEADRTQARFQFGEQQKMEGRKLTDQEQQEKDALGLQKSNSGARERETDYKRALDAIGTGAVTKAGDLEDYPNLTPVDRQQLTHQILAATTQQFLGYRNQEQVAAQANGAVFKHRLATEATEATPGYIFGIGAHPAKPATFKQWTEDDANAALAGAGKQVSQVAPHVHWDEQSQKFVPNAEQPEGYEHWKQGVAQGKVLQDSRASQPPNPGAGVGSPATGAGAAPVAAAAAVGTGYRFGPTNAPPAMPTPAPMPASAPATAMPAGQNPPANPLFQFGQPVGSPVMRSTASGPRRMPTPFYQRVNQLEGAGLPTAQAIAQVLREFSQTQ